MRSSRRSNGILQSSTVQEQAPSATEPARPQRRAQIREVPEQESDRGATAVQAADNQTVRKREVQSAMKVAMKSAMQPLRHSSLQTCEKTSDRASPVTPPEQEPGVVKAAPRRSVVQEKPEETPVTG